LSSSQADIFTAMALLREAHVVNGKEEKGNGEKH